MAAYFHKSVIVSLFLAFGCESAIRTDVTSGPQEACQGEGCAAKDGKINVLQICDEAGANCKSPSSLGTGSQNVVAVSSNTTVTGADAQEIWIVSGSTTITLPLASSVSSGFSIDVKRVGASEVVVLPTGADEIDGINDTYRFTSNYSTAKFLSDGTDWFVVHEMGDILRGTTLVLDGGHYRWDDATYSATCLVYLNHTFYQGEGDATYWIDPDGPGGTAPFSTTCDMTGGGWTLVTSIDFLETYDSDLAVAEKIRVNGDGLTNVDISKCTDSPGSYSDDCTNTAPTVAIAIGSRGDIPAPASSSRVNLTSEIGAEDNYSTVGVQYASNTNFFQWFYTPDNGPSEVTNNMLDGYVCGGGGDNCYDDTDAKTLGIGVTPTGKVLSYVDADGAGAGTFFVWKEKDGSKVLRSNGLDEWQKRLNASGVGFSVTDLTTTADLAGRVCPPNVFVDQTNKFTTDNCLYYDHGTASHTLGTNGSDNINGMTLHGTGGAAQWFEGNVQLCNLKGMRLPTIYESTTTNTTESNYPFADGSPTFALAANGVPGSGYTATATARSPDSDDWWFYNGAAIDNYEDDNAAYFRCVLP